MLNFFEILLFVSVLVSTNGDCVDRATTVECQFWKQSGLCDRSTISDVCQKTCGVCGGGKPKTTPGGRTEKPKPTPGGGGKHTTTHGGGGPKQCGVSPVQSTRIINGHDAIPGAWPWIASLQKYGQHFCGGTLLTPKWVLTASHCVADMNQGNLQEFTVNLGAHNNRAREPSLQQRGIRRVIKNPHWNRQTLTGDQTLLELESPVQLNKRVNVPCLPQRGVYPPMGKVCVLAGWGSLTHPGGVATILQQTKLPVVPSRSCKYNDEVVCVGKGFGTGPDGRQWPNACRGDSGGPLVCQREDGRWQLDGVTSFVYTYCKYYTAYSPVNKYLDWILSYIKN